MKYDFDTVVNRRGTDSIKWNVGEDELPMWIADMDFHAAPAIRASIEKRVSHGIFGYTDISDEWYSAYINWWRSRHGLEIKKEWMIFSVGVVPSISSIVRRLTNPAEKVLLQTPVYNAFFHSIEDNGRRVIDSPLKYDGKVFTVDFDDLEAKLSDPETTLMILCNPHNPVGKIWDAETLARTGELCRRHHVTVISDEIHCDITDPGVGYVPFASVSDVCRDISVTCVAPTKAFNIAGLHSSAVIVPNEGLRNRIKRGLNTDELSEPNSFAECVAVAAFNECGEWLDELRQYIYENKKITEKFISENIPEIKATSSDATYLMWLDMSSLGNDSRAVEEFIRKKTGLFLTAGEIYGGTGKCFVRLNVACPKETLYDGLERLRRGVKLYIEEVK
ncbi:MAG: pyridoxal phosphate-dependent aminotransferase [Firmicutes bacterium]|nr:pyridoxal phosphate-dependent aminotransferase [Bacillota bacterium]